MHFISLHVKKFFFVTEQFWNQKNLAVLYSRIPYLRNSFHKSGILHDYHPFFYNFIFFYFVVLSFLMYVYFETQKTVNTVKHFWNTIVLQRKSQLGLRKQTVSHSGNQFMGLWLCTCSFLCCDWSQHNRNSRNISGVFVLQILIKKIINVENTLMCNYLFMGIKE